MENHELVHWGVRGMRWGVRRYQNKDGTLTAAGKKRYDKEMAKLKAEKKILDNKAKTKAKIDKLENLRKEVDEQKQANKPAIAKPKVQKSKKSTPMTDEELRAKVQRLELEKRYRDLMKETLPKKKKSKGQEFVTDVLEKSGKNIATQAATYAMGVGVNKLFERVFNDKSIVNPKKGQKDK